MTKLAEPSLVRPPDWLALAGGSLEMRDGGDRQWAGPGLPPARGECPYRLCPGGGPPALPLVDPHPCSEPCRDWPPGAPEGRGLEAVEKVVTGRNEHKAV